jgi:hypothetical protein
MDKNLLIIGKPHSSKSTFLIQLYSKLVTNKTTVRLYKPVADISAISEGRKQLSMGNEITPTPPENSSHIEFHLLVGDERIDLNCLDYGGEQINRIIKNRELNKDWLTAIKASNNWILFVRIGNLQVLGDLSTQTTTDSQRDNTDVGEKNSYSISDQTAFIELMQIFLYAKGHDYHTAKTDTKLTVVLTCWDELQTKEQPRQVLQSHLPLFDTFLRSNWSIGSVEVLGLSPQGMSLSEQKNKQKFQVEGSENFGFLITPEGKKINDITELVSYCL